MLYTRPTFTCPTSSNTDQVRWDYAFLSTEEFIAKHGEEVWKTSSEESMSAPIKT